MSKQAELEKKLFETLGVSTLASRLYSLASAVLSGEHVSPERVKRRLEICVECPYSVKSKQHEAKSKCGICGCRIRGDKSLINLALYEETDAYGCKAPAGSKWKAEGV